MKAKFFFRFAVAVLSVVVLFAPDAVFATGTDPYASGVGD
jgi:hypothetical protein